MRDKDIYKSKLNSFPLGEIKPKGWLLRELRIQANGLTGHLDSLWEDVGPSSGWLGGNGESWERGPYYCDGLVPLAYLLEDDFLIRKTKKWIEWTLRSQRDNGDFGPDSSKDTDNWWPRTVMLKVLISYYEATGDERVLSFMKKYFKYELDNIRKNPLRMWAVARACDNILCVYWLYEKTKETFLIELADALFEQSIDWTKYFNDIPYKKRMGEYLNWETVNEKIRDLAESKGKLLNELDNVKKEKVISKALAMLLEETEIGRDIFQKYHTSHIVNIAMGIKEPAMRYLKTGNKKCLDSIKKGIEDLEKYHGTPNGMFTGDEHLNGKNPTQGSELCAVVEYMFSLETSIRVFGSAFFGDILEKTVYNSLPATMTPDLCAHQYVQQVNQVKSSLDERNWFDDGVESNIYGFKPNFGCCTANMHQGWPKFVENLWMKDGEGEIYITAYGPCELETDINGKSLKIIEETDYPFNNKVVIKFEEAVPDLKVNLRIPVWGGGTRVKFNGKYLEDSVIPGTYYKIQKNWKDNDKIEVVFPFKPRFSRWYKSGVAVEMGPLLFASKLNEKWKTLKGIEPFADYEVTTDDFWNYGLITDGEIDIEYFKLDEQPFNPVNPPIIMKVQGKRIDGWKMENNSAGDLPEGPVVSNNEKERIELIPYGCTNLRIGLFPEIKE